MPITGPARGLSRYGSCRSEPFIITTRAADVLRLCGGTYIEDCIFAGVKSKLIRCGDVIRFRFTSVRYSILSRPGARVRVRPLRGTWSFSVLSRNLLALCCYVRSACAYRRRRGSRWSRYVRGGRGPRPVAAASHFATHVPLAAARRIR